MSATTVLARELAPAKVNLLLHVGDRRADGLHEIVSLFAALDLADEIEVRPSMTGEDVVECPGVEGENLVTRALAALREQAPLDPLHVRINKRIPIAAGMGGGSADAAAALRVANHVAGDPLSADDLRALGARLGADVPSQVEPAHALVTGAGEHVAPLPLPAMALVIVPAPFGLGAGEVFAEADRIGATRFRLDADGARTLAAQPFDRLAAGLENDLERAALSLRPEIADNLAALRAADAAAALVTGSGPTAFGVFASRAGAENAAAEIDGALVAEPLPS